MKFNLILLIFLLFSSFGISQNFIQLENKKTGKIKKIRENKRIVIKMDYHQKITGKFLILNSEQISIKGEPLNINEIAKIKRQSLIIGVLGDTFVYPGALVLLVSGIKSQQSTGNYYQQEDIEDNNASSSTAGLITGFSLVGLGSAIKVIGISKNKKRWEYKLIENAGNSKQK